MATPLETLLLDIKRAIARAFAEASYRTTEAEVTLQEPPSRKFGDLAAPCFEAAKAIGQSPTELAQRLAQTLKQKPPRGVKSIEASGGYLNLFLSDTWFTKALGEALATKNWGQSAKKDALIVLDYSCPNVGKPLHIGHIRSTIMGDALKHILSAAGYRCIGVNYLGDAGAQVATLLLGIGDKKPRNERELLEAYTRACEAVQASPKIGEEVRRTLELIEAGDSTVLKRVQRIRKMSLAAFKKTYRRLRITFDKIVGESAFINDAKAITQEALERGIATKGAGGEISVDLEAFGLGKPVLLRANGTTLYLTRDLALADWKAQHWPFTQSIYITASEQDLHFKQVFKILELLGRRWAASLRHIGFGLIFFAGERLSTRAGRVVLLDDVLDEAQRAAEEELEQTLATEAALGLRRRTLHEREKARIAKNVALAALKYAILRVSAPKNISFAIEEATRFTGNTGAYLQYTNVRALGILRKARTQARTSSVAQALAALKKGKAPTTKLSQLERELCHALLSYPAVIQSCAEALDVHSLCDYLYRVATLFTRFYETTPVLKAPPNALSLRLALTKLTQRVLTNGLELLGIPAIKKM